MRQMKHATLRSRLTRALAVVGVAAVAIGPMTAGAATMNSALLGGDKSEEAAEPFEWAGDADCSLCHVKQAEGVQNEDLLAGKHASLDCAFCHEYRDAEAGEGEGAQAKDTAEAAAPAQEGEKAAEDAKPSPTMAEVHAKVDKVSTVKKSSLVNTVVSEGACLTCHDRDTLVEATADCTLLTDAQGTVVNPHDIVEGSQHEGVLCEDCHKMHSNDSAAAYRACVSCHHAEVWECGTCHSYVTNDAA